MSNNKTNGVKQVETPNVKAFKKSMKDNGTRSERLNQWINILTANGTSIDRRSAAFYSCQIVPIDDSELEALFHGSDFARTIIERLVLDAVRNDPIYSIVSPGDATVDPLIDNDKTVSKEISQRWKVSQKIASAAIWGRLYGCGGIILGVDDGSELSAPLKLPISVGSLKWIEVADKRNLLPIEWYTENDAPHRDGDIKVGEPKVYQLQTDGALGSTFKHQTIHESRIMIFGGARTSNRVQALNAGCDLSILQDKYEIIRDVDATWFSMQQLLQDASQSVFKIKNLDQILAADQQALLDRMRIVDHAKGTGRAIIIDAEQEDYYHVGAENLSGIEALLEQSVTRLAAAARMPVTVLMGTSPGGLNATGESDSRNWFSQIESYQKDVLATQLTFLMKVILQSEGLINPGEEVQVDFPSLWEQTENEKIDLLVKKSQAAKTLVDAKILTAEEAKAWFDF